MQKKLSRNESRLSTVTLPKLVMKLRRQIKGKKNWYTRKCVAYVLNLVTMLYHSWDRNKFLFFFFILKIAGKCILSKQGTYSIVNKSATSAPCCHSYRNLLHLFRQISTIKISKNVFSENPDIWRKIEKSNVCWYIFYLNLRMAFILGLENHFTFNFCCNNHQKSQSLKTEKKNH